MTRALAAALLALGLLSSAGCTGSQSGDSFRDNQDDQAPGVPGDEPEELTPERSS